MCPILDGYGVMAAWNLQYRVKIIENKWNKIINLKYKFNFPSWICLQFTLTFPFKQVFESATAGRNPRCRSAVNNASCKS